MRPATFGRLLLLAVVWGASFLLIKVAVAGMHPALVSFGRVAVGAAVVVVILVVQRVRLPSTRSEWAKLGVLAVFANMVPFTLIAAGETQISSGLASLLNATTPLWTAIVASTLIRTERMTLVRSLGIALGFAGVAILVVPGSSVGGGSVAGSLAVIAASASYGLAASYTKRYISTDPLPNAAGQLIIATAGMAAVVAVLAPGHPPALTPIRVAAVATLGAVGTGIAWIVFHRIIREEGATTASLVTYMVPFVSVVLGHLVLHESLRWTAYVGGVIVIAGIVVAERRAPEPPTILAPADVTRPVR